MNIIKSQPLERLTLYHCACIQRENKNDIYALEFRSATLKELTFSCLDFQNMDLAAARRV